MINKIPYSKLQKNPSFLEKIPTHTSAFPDPHPALKTACGRLSLEVTDMIRRSIAIGSVFHRVHGLLLRTGDPVPQGPIMMFGRKKKGKR
jgi:hypothetical protein